MMGAGSPFGGGAVMLKKQQFSRSADVALLSLLVLEAVFVTAGVAIPPASTQAADAQAQTDSFVSAPQQPTPDATSGRTFHSIAPRGTKGWIALHRPDG